MNRAALDKWCERGILALVLIVLVFGPLAIGAVLEPDFLVIQGLTAGAALLWVARLWLNPRPQLLWPPVCWAAAAFTLYAVIRYFTADIEYVARRETMRVLVYAFLFLVILNNLHRQELTHIISLTLIFLAMGISLYAVYQFLTDSNKVETLVTLYPHRGSGTYVSPNHLGGFLEQILPLALACTLVSRARTVTKVFTGYAALVILAGIAVTVSRGSWISTGLALIVFFVVLLFHRTYRLPSSVFLILLLGAGYCLLPRNVFFQTRFKEIPLQINTAEADTRFALWKSAVQLWREHPWFGIGPGHYDYCFGKIRPPAVQRQPDRVHNDYLNTLTDWGIIGTALIASAWTLLFAGAFKTARFVRRSPGDLGGRQSNKFALVLGASAGLLAILCHSAVDFNMHLPANAILAITLMALLSGCLRFATERCWVRLRPGINAALSLILVVGAGCLGWQTARGAAESFWLARADQAPNFSPAQIAALEKAFAWDPRNAETAYAIGEACRVESWEGAADYRELAEKAMRWFQSGMTLNPHDNNNFMRYGMCLDWLGRHGEARPYFDQAVLLDPNSYFTVAHMGWHYVQIRDYAAAKAWFERSVRLEWQDNPIAVNYLQIVTQKMLEAATNQSPVNLEAVAP